jgi:23S rRNA (uracil1939-C5)-methyltransferase
MMRVEIQKIVYPGRRLGLLEGKVVFTDRGLPGETVEVEVLKDRKRYTEARTLRILSPSPSRIEPRCAHFLACSPYQDMDYGLELEVKRAQVAEIMSRELRRPFDAPGIEPSPEVWGYRNRIRLRVRWEGDAAHFVYNEPGEQASYVAVDRCHLVPDRMNDLLSRTLGLINGGPFPAVAGVEVRASRANGQSLLVLDLESGGQAQELGIALAGLKKEFDLVGAVASVYDGKTRRDERLFGRDFLEERVHGLTFRIGARSFFQTNIGILEKVFDDVAAAVAPRGEATVADLYCGLGTFGLFLAGTAREVFGVEPAAENIAFLKKNLTLNRVGNFAVCEGTAEEWLDEILERSPEVVVLDPPRKGVDPRVVEGLVGEPAPLLLYLSCNPTTLARDLKGLLGAYEIADLRIYDFFPHTPHIEVLAVLEGRRS